MVEQALETVAFVAGLVLVVLLIGWSLGAWDLKDDEK